MYQIRLPDNQESDIDTNITFLEWLKFNRNLIKNN